MADFLSEFHRNLVNYFYPNENPRKFSKLFWANSKDLGKKGDISFPLQGSVWHQVAPQHACDNSEHGNIFACRLFKTENVEENVKWHEEEIEQLVKTSQDWKTPIDCIKIFKRRCLVFLHRPVAMKELVIGSLQPLEELSPMISFKTVLCDHSYNQNNLTEYRAFLINKIIANILRLTRCDINSIQVTAIVVPNSQSNPPKREADETIEPQTVVIRSGLVTDSTRKISRITTAEYTSIRQNDMELAAIHKYGERARDSNKQFKTLIKSLGEAAVKFDLLEARFSSPVSVKLNNLGPNKGAAFILYNSARIESIMRTFNQHIMNGIYPHLPPPEEIDYALLKEEEEWELLFGYVLPLPHLLTSVLDGIETGTVHTNLLIQYICGMTGTFSVYYRRVRFLLNGRNHLMPLVHARITLLKCLQRILKLSLGILDIDILNYM